MMVDKVKKDVINGIDGLWLKIKFKDTFGYVFEPYATKTKFNNEVLRVYTEDKKSFYIIETKEKTLKLNDICPYGEDDRVIVRIFKKGREVFYHQGFCPLDNGFKDKKLTLGIGLGECGRGESESLVFDLVSEKIVEKYVVEQGFPKDNCIGDEVKELGFYESYSVCNFDNCVKVVFFSDNRAVIGNDYKEEEIKFKTYELTSNDLIFIDGKCWKKILSKEGSFKKCNLLNGE